MSVLEPSQSAMWEELDYDYFSSDKANVTGCAQTHGPQNLARSSLETHLGQREGGQAQNGAHLTLAGGP
ncbi:hypothetical protein TrVFT333_009823 [Trichoderma virens FT-333]|nr:hypothetical protein TrVFT333_009823 [Trichoderma virens FT-333]